MGRKKNMVYRYFELNENKTATCLVTMCGKILKTQHSGNLMKHLQHVHKDVFKEVSDLNNSRHVTATTSRQNTVSAKVLEECTKLVAVHGRPFSMMNDEAFKNLLSLIPENTITINTHKIRENVKSMAIKMRDDLAATLNDRVISIKVDIASLGTRSFMGINCQYLEDGVITLRNLGTVVIFQRHTSEHLKDILIYNLHRYRIDTELKKQIYCITTDNGANMIKMSKLINESFNVSGDIPTTSSSHQINDTAYQHEDSDTEFDSIEYSDSELDHTYTTQVTNVLREQFITREVVDDRHEIGIIRCAAHTAQLALQDVFKDIHTSNLILSCREVVRRLRTPHFVRLLRDSEKNVPKLDCATRWHSTIDMVESILSLREICNMDERLHLPISTWDNLSELVTCLTPARELIKKLQAEQLTVGDFYIAWMLCQLKITKINSRIANDLANSMKSREKNLFENDTFINGILLDPRLNSVLSPDQLNRAKANCVKLYIEHVGLEQADKENINTDNSLPRMISERTSEAQSDLDDILNSSYIEKHDLTVLIRRESSTNILLDLQESLNKFLDEPLLKSTENVLLYWEKSKEKFPSLYKLSTVILAAPMTQVSVERLFSSLKFVLSNNRMSMKDSIIEDLLFIRSNKLYNLS